MRSARSRFYGHAGRLALFVAIALAVAAVVLACAFSIARALPERTTVRGSNDDDANDDAVRKKAAPEALVPGGEQVRAGVQGLLAQHDRYNAVLARVAKDTGQGARMAALKMDRTVFDRAHDDWTPVPGYKAVGDPETITREITFFNL